MAWSACVFAVRGQSAMGLLRSLIKMAKGESARLTDRFPVTPDIYWMVVETTVSLWTNGAVQQSSDQPENASYDEINGNDITQ